MSLQDTRQAQDSAYSQQANRLSLPRGIYETVYGNAAYVSGPKAKTAYDLDMGERIPMAEVTSYFIRRAEPGDRGRAAYD